MPKITNRTQLNLGIEITVNTSTSRIGLNIAGNLSTDGVTLQAIFGFLLDLWEDSAAYSFFSFPMQELAIDQYELVGWDWLDSGTQSLLRDGGFAVSSGSTITQEWLCALSGGNVVLTAQVYYELTGTKVNLSRLGEANEVVQTFQQGSFDSRAAGLTLFAREWGREYTKASLLDQGVINADYKSYLLPLSTEIDINITELEVDVASESPFTGVVLTILPGTGFTDWDNAANYAVNAVVSRLGRWYRATSSNSNDPPPSANWTSFEGEREVDEAYYPFTKIFSNTDNATLSQVYHKERYLFRQNSDIDSGSGTLIGALADPLMNYVGNILHPGAGVWIESVPIGDRPFVSLEDATGTTVEYPQEAFVTAPNVEDGVRVWVADNQSFTLTVFDSDTTLETLRVPGHRFRKSNGEFPTVCYVLGLDPPVPIIVGGIYYVGKIGTADGLPTDNDIQLSTDQDGLNIVNLADNGSGTYQLVGNTELDNSVVTGGSGYSKKLELPNGAAVLFKAQGYQNSSSPAIATSLFQRVLSWSALSGASVIDTISFAVTPDSVHNLITSANEYVSDGADVTGLTFDVSGTVQIDVNASGQRIPTQDFYAWLVYQRSTESGIRLIGDNMFGDGASFKVRAPVQIQNVVPNTVVTITGAFLSREDSGQLVVADSSSGIIAFDFDSQAIPYTVASGSGLDATQSNQLNQLWATLQSSGVFSEAALANAPTGGAGEGATPEQIWTYTTRSLTDKAGFSLSSTGIQAVWEYSARSLTTFGSLVTDITTAVWSAATRSLTTFGSLASDVWAVATRTITARPPNTASETSVAAIPTTPLLTNDARLNSLDATISSRAVPSDLMVTVSGGFTPDDRTELQSKLNATAYTAPNNTGITTLLDRATEVRLSKLDVTGTLANTSNADTFKATGFSTHSATDVFNLINPELTAIDTAIANIVIPPVDLSGIPAAVWGYTGGDGRTLSGFVLADVRRVNDTVVNIADFRTDLTATNTAIATLGSPVQSDDARLDFLDASIDSRATPADVAVTVQGGFTTTDQQRLLKLTKAIGLEPGISASQLDPQPGTPGYLRTSDNTIRQTLALTPDGAITISLDA